MVFYWYFIEISTGFPMQIHWYFIEISIEFQLDFDWKIIVISTGCPLDFHCNFNTVSTGLQMFFDSYYIEISTEFQLDFRMMSIRIIEISTGLPMDFNWYFIEISTGFPMGIHWYFIEISIELQLDFQCASTWPASSQKFPRTSRTKLTKKKPVYVSGPAMALHQKQHWSDPLWDCHSLPPSPPPPLSSPWTPPATPPPPGSCWEELFFYWPLGGGALRAATQYLDTLGLDKYTRSLNGSTSLRIHIKSTNKHWLWDEIQYFLSFNHSAGSPCPGWRRSTPPWWPFGWDSTTQAVPMAQELSCLVSSHSRFI